MSSKFRFKGSSTTTRQKTSWSVEVKARVLQLVDIEEMTAPDAVSQAAEEFGIDLTDKPSYTKNAGSHVSRFRNELANAMSNPKHKKHADAVKACLDAGLPIEEVDFEVDEDEEDSDD